VSTGGPAEEVHNFLGRPGPRRGTRTLRDHLSPRPARPPAPVPAQAPVRTAPAPAPAPLPVVAVGSARQAEQLLVLDDERPTVTVEAARRTGGTLRVLLQWEQQVTSTGLHRSSDVHLGCFWQTRDRHSGAVQSLGDLLTAPGYGARQVLRLGGRSEDGGEELLVDAKHLDLLRRVVFYAYAVGPSPVDFEALSPHLTVRRRDGGRMQMWAAGAPAGSRTCAIASLHDVHGDLVVRRENEFFPGPQRDVALAYGFDDLEWGPDGTVPRHA